MAEYLIQDSTLTAIGNAIREKKLTNSMIPVTSMADEILSIQGGNPYTVPVLNENYPEDKKVTKNEVVTNKIIIDENGYPASYAYQWYANGIAVEGATDSTYAFTPGALGTTTLYCEVTSDAGVVVSRTATISAEAFYIVKNGVFQNGISFNRQLCNAHTLNLSSASGYISCAVADNDGVGLASNNQIDCTKYTTLIMEHSGGSEYRTYGFGVGLLSDPNSTADENVIVAKFKYRASSTSSGWQSLKVNIADANSNFYVGIFMIPANHYGNSTTSLYNIWLE